MLIFNSKFYEIMYFNKFILLFFIPIYTLTIMLYKNITFDVQGFTLYFLIVNLSYIFWGVILIKIITHLRKYKNIFINLNGSLYYKLKILNKYRILNSDINEFNRQIGQAFFMDEKRKLTKKEFRNLKKEIPFLGDVEWQLSLED